MVSRGRNDRPVSYVPYEKTPFWVLQAPTLINNFALSKMASNV